MMNWFSRLFQRNTKYAAQSVLMVELEDKTVQISLRPKQRLLDAMLGAGLNIPFSCEEGICGSCQCKLLTGNVEMKANHFLTSKELAQGNILACQSVATSKQVKIQPLL